MATYAQIYLLRNDGELLSRFVVAVEKAAADILVEAPATTNHAERIAWAKRVILETNRSQEYATRIMRVALQQNQALQDNGNASTDAAIQSLVNGYAAQLAVAGL